jgi:hypothetical protein
MKNVLNAIGSTPVKTEYVRMFGGLDLESPVLSIPPGALLAGENYVAGVSGGYRKIDGYERYDGHTSPSDAVYYYCEVTLTVAVTVGQTITGVTSGATGTVCTVGTGYLNITKVTGTFEAEDITVGGGAVGSIDSVPELEGETTALLHDTAKGAAAGYYRSDIAAPTGSGAIRGIAILKGVVYCFRDNAGGTAGLIYKATSSGWSAITLGHELSFTTGTAAIADGNTVTQAVSGASATVKRVVLQSGTWTAGTAAGRLILSGITGTFDATNNLLVGGGVKAVSSSLATAITIAPAGRYETVEYNFYGQEDSTRIYGCDGVNRGFEFDGTTYVPLVTGMSPDTPLHVFAHKKQLFFSFRASSQNSGVGDPYQWTAISGAAEIAVGNDITGYMDLGGDALGIFSAQSSKQLTGSDSDDFVLDNISNEIGCVSRTLQKLGFTICLDSGGIIIVSPTDVYGNFVQKNLSRKIQKLIDRMVPIVTASSVYRKTNQYRLYGNDGTGICLTFLDKAIAFTVFEYPVNVACAVTGRSTTGEDIIFFGSDAGMVYQADKGTSFDGEDIEHFLVLPFNHSRGPTMRKQYRRVVVEMSANGYVSLKYTPDFDYGDSSIGVHPSEDITSPGAGGYWNVDSWNEFFYDAKLVNSPSLHVNGAGTNMNLVIYGKSAVDPGHSIDGMIVHYTPRRIQR